MIIDLRTIEHVPRRFDFSFESMWWESEKKFDQILGLDGVLECHIDISKSGSRYIIDGSISGCVLLACDRCLEPYRYLLDVEFHLFPAAHISDPDLVELDLSEDDMSVVFVEENKVDLYNVVQEQIFISLPMKSLCRDACYGLCPVCGTNLNKQSCECRRGEGHPEFSKLKALILNEEN